MASQGNTSRDWANLPTLGSILELIKSPCDYVRWSMVCTRWNFIWNSFEKDRIKSGHYFPPMLLVPGGRKARGWRCYDIVENRFHGLIRISKKRYHGSSHGWLIQLNDDHSVTLSNPFSPIQKLISLPQLHPPPSTRTGSFFKYATSSSSNLRARLSGHPIEDPNTLLVLLFEHDVLAFTRTSTVGHRGWSYLQFQIPGVQNVLCLASNHMCFVSNRESGVFKFAVTDDENNRGYERLVLDREYHDYQDRVKNLPSRIYLVESVGHKILMIERYIDYNSNLDPKTVNFKVFELCDNSRVEIESIGDECIFVGANTAISVLAKDFPGCITNSIYFLHDSFFIDDDYTNSSDRGLYKLDTAEISVEYIPDLQPLLNKANRRTMWVTPTFRIRSVTMPNSSTADEEMPSTAVTEKSEKKKKNKKAENVGAASVTAVTDGEDKSEKKAKRRRKR